MTLKQQILQTITELQDQGVPHVVATVVRTEPPTSAKPGDKAVVDAEGVIHGWIGGGCAQPAVTKSALQALEDGQPRLIRIAPGGADESLDSGIVPFGSSCPSGGTLDIFLEPHTLRHSLLILGDSPVARALSLLAGNTGLHVTAIAPGAEASHFPGAAQVHASFGAAATAVGDWAVVATQGRGDTHALVAALGSPARKVAFIASKRKAETFRERLRNKDVDPARVEALIAPAGIEIGARTPEEIALAVLASVVRDLRLGDDSAGHGVSRSTADSIPAVVSNPADPVTTGGCCGGN